MEKYTIKSNLSPLIVNLKHLGGATKVASQGVVGEIGCYTIYKK
ncbi:hypothetical protein MNB_SUP05-SYMBIONT-5-209 [hydrothermal vent metagenome]|uniref:Uncharacterized protein n=1 Tax=hydrothermal vent metagenome TaxID=652676 RepID=A0A1W1E5I0_9ZZZZ